jgi:hypothetical protein
VLHGKFSDLLAARQLTSFYEQVIVENARGDPQQIAEKIYGPELAWFFDQWLGPYPSVDYLIDSVRRRRVGKKWSYAITIAKHSRRPVIEPVQVLAEEYGGARHFLIWNGEAGEDNENLIDEPVSGKHTFEIVTNRRLRYVRVDPRSRLAEQARPPRANVDPRFNNRSPPSFRFLYTGAQLSIAASEFVNAKTTAARFNAITGFFAFEGSLRRDLRRSGSVTIARDRETDVEGGLGIGFGFGEKTNPQRRRARVSLFATASLLNARSLDPRGGVRTTQRIGLSDDTTRVGWWPESGRRLSIGLLARQIHRVDDGPEDPAYDLSIDAGWTHLWRLAHHHVLATSLFGQMVIPIEGPTEFRALTRAGGIGGLSGYVGDELFGLAMLLAQAEYRHEFVGDLRVNFFNLIHLRGFGGVLFGGGASLSRCDSYGGWFAPDSWYGHIGYGLTARLALLGVSPQLVRLDVSVPLVRRRTTCLGRDLPDYLAEVQGLEDASRLLPPLQFNLSFVHPF